MRNKLYYGLKPFIPLSIRTSIRRSLAIRKREKVTDSWPIFPGSERPPEGWPGWPEGKKFALVLTHDVESKVGAARCRQLMGMELERGFRSSFNFIPEGGYRVEDALRQELISSGFEVGLHDLKHDGKLFSSHLKFTKHAARINEHLKNWNAVGFRSGFMLRNLGWLRQLDLLYDSSTFDTDPFEPQPDGAGTIFPFWVADGNNRGYVELPYTLPQDSTLFVLFREKTIEIWKRKLDWLAKNGGMALVNVHPDYMNFSGAPRPSEYPASFYQEFLDYAKSQYAGAYWNALPKEVAYHALSAWQETPKVSLSTPIFPSPNRAGDGTVPDGSARQTAPTDTPNMRPTGESAPTPRVSNSPFKAAHERPLAGKRAIVVLFSHFPGDARPRRAAEALVQEGMSVEMICLTEGNGEPAREVRNGVSVRRLPIQRKRGGVVGYLRQYSTFIAYSFAILAVRSVRRHYDLVHVHNMPDVLVFSSLVPKMLGAKVIIDLHDPMPELMMTIFGLKENSNGVKLLKFLEKLSIALANRVLTVNRACQKIFAARSCRFDKIEVIMNSPNEAIFEFRPTNPAEVRNAQRPFVIMYHGSIVERHGLDLAVTALSQIRKDIPLAELRICGASTPFLEQVLQSVKGSDLEGAVIYRGPMAHERIVKEIDQCDVGIIPNRRSIFTELNTPTRIFEYLSRGKPVIAPSAPGILDYFKKSELVLFELGDAADLAAKIRYVHDHPAEIERVVKAGQQVYSNHLWSCERQKFLNVVRELTCARR